MEKIDTISDQKETYDKLTGGTSAATTMSRAVVEVTNRRYQSNPFWGGPKGLLYGQLRGRLPIQLANLYPDGNTSYFVGQFNLPPDSYLEIKGNYGHMRYFSLTVANQYANGVSGNGTFLRDNNIEPDEGSINPFVSTNPRDVPDDQRKYTVWLRQGVAPEIPPKNTLYTGSNNERAGIHLALRCYVADNDFDGTGNVRMPPDESGLPVSLGLPEVILHLPAVNVPIPGATHEKHVEVSVPEVNKRVQVSVRDEKHIDEKTLTGEKMCKAVRASKAQQPYGFPVDQWLKLVAESWDPTNAPAVSAPSFQRFWNMGYSVVGGFIVDPVERVLAFPPNNDGAFLTNPDTIYMVATFSLAFGQVVVIRGKMPSFPKTKHGQKEWPSEPTQLRYWSLTTGAAPPSGFGWATIFDEQIPLDDGDFTVVMSRAEDRPQNAAREYGVKWIEFGGGEGHYIGARNWVNFVYIRYQAAVAGAAWPESPQNIPMPTKEHPAPMDAVVMGPYYPRAKYMSKEEFERLGPQTPVPANVRDSSADNA